MKLIEGKAAAAATRASMRRSMVMRSRATDGRNAPKCQGKRPDQPARPPARLVEWEQQSAPRAGLAGRPQKRKYSRQFGIIRGIPIKSDQDLSTRHPLP